MKLKVVSVENGDYNQAIKTALIIGAISYGKIYELLHKQIWRKTPSRVWTYAIPHISTFNGRPVTFIRGWNIKSPSTNPYSYSVPDGTPADMTFGLNQLFMEQDYRKTYNGDVGDGIYHDDCYIQPKMQVIPNGEIECWGYWTQSSWEDPKIYSQIFRKQDENGTILINNVSYEIYSVTTTETTTTGTPPVTTTTTIITDYSRLVVSYANGSTSTIELGERNEFSPSEGLDFGKVYAFTGNLESWEQIPDLSGHGALLYEQAMPNNSFWNFTAQAKDGWIRAYEDGTVIEYVPLAVDGGGESYYSVPANLKILPMMYTDTGDLVMNRVEFVEKWNDYFELIVHEDSEWWEAFIKPIAAIITLVIAINTGLYFGVDSVMFNVAVAGGIISSIGILADNSTLSLIGGLMVGYVGIEKMLTDGYMQSLVQSGVMPDRAEMLLSNATFSDLFKGFVSSAGLSNWAKIGFSTFGPYNQAQMLGMEMPTMEATVEDESGMRVTIKDDSEEDLFAELYKKAGIV